jgi:hypothetical protein
MLVKSERTGIKAHRIPEKSVVFDRIIPLLIVILGIVMLLLIVFAIGVLAGVVRWA